MNWIPLFCLLAACLLLMLLERIGLPTTLVLNLAKKMGCSGASRPPSAAWLA